MKGNEDVEKLLTEYSRLMVFEGKARIGQRLRQSAAVPSGRHSLGARRANVLIAALLMLTVGTVWADDIVRVIREVAFSGLQAVQVERLPAEEGDPGTDGVTTRYTLAPKGDDVKPVPPEDRAAFPQIETHNLRVSDMDEVRSLLDFEVHEPAWLPEDYRFAYATLTRYPSGAVSQAVSLHYQKPHWGNMFQITLNLTYIGAEGGIDFETVEPIEHIRLGDADAMMMKPGSGSEVEIIWTQDRVAYALYAQSEDEAKKIAESIG